MQTRREYAHSLGLAKMGRGKFSSDAKAAIAKAEGEGMKFSDTPTGASAAPTKDSPAAPTRSVSAGDSPYICPSDFRFPEAEYKAVGTDGKTYGMRECCNTCRVSLTNHFCDSPTIHGNMVVHIRKR